MISPQLQIISFYRTRINSHYDWRKELDNVQIPRLSFVPFLGNLTVVSLGKSHPQLPHVFGRMETAIHFWVIWVIWDQSFHGSGEKIIMGSVLL